MRNWPLGVLSLLIAAAILGGVASPALAQGGSTAAPLSGVVVDPSGGVIPGADVVVKQNGTPLTARAVTDSQGRFAVPPLPPGTYTVTVSLMGFKTAVYPDVPIVTATPASIKVTLAVGDLSETVVVTGASEIVQTQSASVTTTLTTQQINTIPLATRNTLDFVAMLPGVNTTSTLRTSTIMGLRQNAINITIDGINVQDNFQKNADGFFAWIFPRMDAVEEVTVSTANPGAESSGQGAVQIRFSTRSGSNKFSGSAYEYMRRPQWNTAYWFNKQAKLGADQVRVDTWGGRLGGPIFKDKLFFFVNVERFKLPNESLKQRTVLTPDAINGIYTYNSGPAAVNLFALAASFGQMSTPDPTLLKVLNSIQATTTQGTMTSTGTPITRFFSWKAQAAETDPFNTGRIDWNISKNHRLGTTVYIQAINRIPDHLNSVQPAFPDFPTGGNTIQNRNNRSVNLRSTLTPTMVNELRVGRTGGTVSFYTNVQASDFDFLGGYAVGFPIVTTPYIVSGPSSRHAPATTAENTLNWLKGKHSFTFGGTYTHLYGEFVSFRRVPTISLGLTSGDPALGTMFSAASRTANFPGISDSDFSSAQSLYALLTGRVSGISGDAYKGPDGKYHYLGDTNQQSTMDEFGFFAQDAWRLRPGLTVNFGLRYELQLPFKPTNLLYARVNNYNEVWGISGVDTSGNPNLFKPNVMTGKATTYVQLNQGDKIVNTDYGAVAPSMGFAWRPSVKNAFLKTLAGSDPVIRAGYSLSFIREGFNQLTNLIGANPGSSVNAGRNSTLGNLVGSTAELPVLFRNPSLLGPAPFVDAPTYPYTGIFTDSANVWAPDTKTPKAHSFNIGFQRQFGRNTAVEIRYVGTRQRGTWWQGGRNMNENNIIENGFINEFKLAQANLQANIAAGRGSNFKYWGPGTGTSPLPTYLAFFTGLPSSAATDPASYLTSGGLSGNNFATSAYVTQLAIYNPSATGAASSLFGNATQRTLALQAGLPANIFVVNPGLGSGGAWITGRPEDSLNNNYDALQFELRRRMSGGFLVQGSYQWVMRSSGSNYTTLRKAAEMASAGIAYHAVKLNWAYELPFGQGGKFGGGAGRALNILIGGWTFDGSARLQSGNLIDWGNLRLVGMTDKDLKSLYKLRFAADANGVVRAYMLPQDVIDNTIKAFSTSATSSTGYGSLGPPIGRYFAPIQGPDCIQAYTGSCGLPMHHYVYGPTFTRFDMSIGKRINLTKKIFTDFRFEVLNVLDNVNFRGRSGASTSQSGYEVTSAYQDLSNTQDPGGRLVQLVFRISF